MIKNDLYKYNHEKFVEYNISQSQIDFIINDNKIEKIIITETDVTNNLVEKYNYIIVMNKDSNGNLYKSLFYFLERIDKKGSKYIFHISDKNNYNTIYLPSDDFQKYDIQYKLYEKKYKIANLSFGRCGSTVQIYNMNKLGFKYFDYQQTVEDRFDSGFNVLIAVLRNPIGRLQSSHKRRLENIGCDKKTQPYYHKYRNTFNDVNDYINALKDTDNPHHKFVMDELINNKLAAEQTPIIDYYLMDKNNEKKNKIRIIWVDFENYKKDWKLVTNKELENIKNDMNFSISSNNSELKKKSNISDENKEWVNKHSVFKEDYKLYEKICCKNRNSDYPVITNGAGEIINYPIFDNIDIANFKLDIFKDYIKEYNKNYNKNGRNEIEYINSGQVGKLFQWNKDNKWDHYHITTTQHHFPLYIEKLKKMGLTML